MGGIGSGRWTRWDSKETTGSRLSIDVRKLKPAFKSGEGTVGYVSSRSPEGCERSLSFVVMDGYMLLGTNPTLNNVDISGGINELRFVHTGCNFGGQRNWISCPACQGRVAVVYLKDRRFACRQCCNLSYATQQADKLERLILRTQRLRRDLGSTEGLAAPIPDKLKGMHWRTYWIKVQKAVQAERVMNKEANAVFCIPDILRGEAG